MTSGQKASKLTSAVINDFVTEVDLLTPSESTLISDRYVYEYKGRLFVFIDV